MYVKSRILFLEHNFCLIDFYFLLKSCEVNLITDLDNYGLLAGRKITKDTKRLLLHHLSLCICEYILKHKNKEKNVIYYSNNIPNSISLTEFFDVKILEPILNQAVLKIKKSLPVRIHINHLPFKDVMESENGKKDEIINNVKNTLENTDLTQFTFNKSIAFAKRQGLSFLSKEYLNSIKTKQLLIG